MNEQQTELFQKAVDFIERCYGELGIPADQQQQRLQDIEQEIEISGTYTHTSVELTHGAKMAWRNSNRCIGRLLWETLEVFDRRDVTTAGEAFDALQDHIRYATNDGDIQSSITVFPPRKDGRDSIRIWNHQLIRYAGYELEGAIIGDFANVFMTKRCESLGWQGAHTSFDVLPLVIQQDGQTPKLYKLPDDLVKEVSISHPDIPGVETLGIKWHAVPIISDMRLEIGGIDYPMAPFNGWYMGTEIGARNLADQDRYNLLPAIAKQMGLATNSNRSLWMDKALVELNIAVLHSYHQAGVTLVDHHTAAKQFKAFEKKEKNAGRPVTGNWAWLIPPVSPATTHIFNKPYRNDIVTPNFFHQASPKDDE